MAAMLQKTDSRISLEIRTKSVEQTLVPLVTQITTLVNHKERTKVTDKTQRALVRVGEAVNLAVERFTTVGESIAVENPEIRDDMCEACQEARIAGSSIQTLTASDQPNDGTPKAVADKTAMVRAARQLLSAITKVLLLADRVVVKQLLMAKDKVLFSLNNLEDVSSFPDFVTGFTQFGKDMVELALLSGERQNDLKSEKHRAQMGSARAILEKSTMMLLRSSKFCNLVPCRSGWLVCAAKMKLTRRWQVRYQLREEAAIRTTSGGPSRVFASSPLEVVPSSSLASAGRRPSHPFLLIHCSLKFCVRVIRGILRCTPQHLKVAVHCGLPVCTAEVTAGTAGGSQLSQSEAHPNPRIQLVRILSAFDFVIDTAQDFTDSAYTSHMNREKILSLSDALKDELQDLLKVGQTLNSKDTLTPTQELETAILKTIEASKAFRKQLLDTAMDQASELFKMNEDHELLQGLRIAGMNGDVDQVEELTIKFEEHQEQLEEVCKLLHHLASTDPLVITAEHNESFLHSIGPLTLYAAQTLAQYPCSKVAKENLEVFGDAWKSQINDLSILVKEVNDVCQGKMDKPVYLSLPRPGSSTPPQKHGTTARSFRPAKLDAEEQAKIAKLGLEMKLITSEMDAETDKWEEPDNDIVKRAKNMSSMAFAMYLFTRGEGPLKTTQDLFVQADYFAEEGNKLYKTVMGFAQRVPPCHHKEELLMYLDRVPVFCQQLAIRLKAPTFGKTPTFNKVDSTIQETKNLMNVIAKVVTTCFICATKFNIDYRVSPGGSYRWRCQYEGSRSSAGSDTDGGGLSPHSEGGAMFRSSSISPHSESLYRTSSLSRSLSTEKS
ncbi:alpha-catulin-like [Haliotis rubra]|uniref:alpha-catulin-like n=1 Tax=Haliotis rubra TaxID=36100 RepID=UPI001EE50942|nr:alpha-catulin-like [Haliotis rubra]